MQYIILCETPFPSHRPPGRCLHARKLTRDQVLASVRRQWTAIEQTLAILDGASDQEGANGRHFGVPIDYPIGRHLLHVDGKMDFETRRYARPCPQCHTQGKPCLHRIPLVWVDPDHVCSIACLTRPYQRTSHTHFTRA